MTASSGGISVPSGTGITWPDRVRRWRLARLADLPAAQGFPRRAATPVNSKSSEMARDRMADKMPK